MARDRAQLHAAPGALRRGVGRERPGRAADPRGHQLDRGPPVDALGPDDGQPVHAVGPDEEGPWQPQGAGQGPGLRERAHGRSLSRSAHRVHARGRQAGGRVHRAAEAARAGQPVPGSAGRHGRVRVRGAHGEKDTGSTERTGYSGAASALGGDNFTVEKVVLAQQTTVPADAAVLVVAGPRTDYLPAEMDMLRAYLRKGGKVLLMLDPPESTDSAPVPNLIAFAREWGVDAGNNVVVDLSPAGRFLGTGPSIPVAASYPTHAINERMETLTAYPLARSITPAAAGADGRVAQSIVETSQNSWAETDLKALSTTGEARREEDKGDKAGPISLAAAVSAAAPEAPAAPEGQSKAESRVVIFGDSDFASNLALGVQGNRDFFLNAVNWLAQQENMIAIRAKEPSDRRVTMTAEQQQRVYWLALFIIPGLIILAGVQSWWRRR
ncbi:MAG: Gldg family protein [Acidobacteria bacterium]|nr:Gldg family protein [Acidobacteriota bacterium]